MVLAAIAICPFLIPVAACLEAEDRRAAAFSEALDRAAHLREAERHMQAAVELGKAATLRPEDALVRSRLAELYQTSRLWDAAEAAYRQALALTPAPQTFVALAELLRSQRRIDEAVHAYHSALELDPASAEASFGLCLALISAESFEGAVFACRLGTELNPDDVATRRRLGLALLKLERFQQAAEVLLHNADLPAEQRSAIVESLPSESP